MKVFLELVKRELKNNRKINSNPSTFSKIFNILLKLLMYLAIIVFESVLFRMVIKLFVFNTLTNEFLTLFLFLFFVVQLLINLVNIVKIFNKSNENIEILTLPIKQETIFYSKLFILFIKQLVFSFVCLVPVLINFSLITNQGFLFVLSIIPCVLLNSIFAIAIAVILSIPTLYLVKLVSNRFTIVSILYFLLIIIGFSIYILILKQLLEFFQTDNFVGLISLDLIYVIQDICSNLHLFMLLKNILINSNFISSLIILVTFAISLFAVINFFAKKLYFKVLRSSLLKEPKFSTKITKLKKHTKKYALLIKEIKNIFRSPNYSFSFFVISFSTPILVFCCNALISELGIKLAGSLIYPALAILILSLFMIMAGSFSATSITREGKNFPATKTYPITFKEQISVKLSLYLLVEIPTLIISLLCLLLSGYIEIFDFIMISLIVGSLTYASMTNGINLDVKKPQFNYLNHNEITQNNSNISKNLSMGIVLGIIISLICIVLLFLISKTLIYFIIFTLTFAYAILSHYKLFKNIEEKYILIEY